MFDKKIDIKNNHVQGDLVMGNKIGVSEQALKAILREEFSVLKQRDEIPINKIKELADNLLNSFVPPSLLPLFPNVNPMVNAAISSLEWENRWLIEQKNDNNLTRMVHFNELLTMKDYRHLIVSPGGSGKTYSLWHFCSKLLKTSAIIPIYLSLSDFSGSIEIQDFLKQKLQGYDIALLVEHPSIIFALDGWSQFTQEAGNNHSESRKLLAFLGQTRILATGRFITPYDDSFTFWEMDKLSLEIVQSTLNIGLSNINALPSQEILDFLRLPLTLILYMLLGGQSSTYGELLCNFQKYLTQHYANWKDLLKVMGKASARLALLYQDMKIISFEEEVSSVSKELEVQNANLLIQQLGTLGNRYDVLQPIHDIYWDWLIGIGILTDWENVGYISSRILTTRNQIKFALESGERLDAKFVQEIYEMDLVFAAMFVPYLMKYHKVESEVIKKISDKIEGLLNSRRVVDYYRGIMAALLSESSELFPQILNPLSQLVSKGFYFREIEENFPSKLLWEHRDCVSNWLDQNKSKYYLLNPIKLTGDSRWVEWSGQQFLAGNLTRGEAIEIALACGAKLPEWVEVELPLLLKEEGAYHLKAAVEKGVNLPLARWVAANYFKYVSATNSTFFDLNKVIVKCGNDKIFENLFEQFEKFPSHVQELLIYAFIERDPSWIIRLQEKCFKEKTFIQHHKLFEFILPEVSDANLRTWIQSKDTKIQIHGWRTLAKKYQNEILAELIKHLPESFDNLHSVPALKAMQQLAEPPESLLQELWKRLKGSIQPMLMEDFIRVLANIHPTGLVTIANELSYNPLFLPSYHLSRFIEFFKEWEKKTGMKMMVKDSECDLSLIDQLLLINIRAAKGPDFLDCLISEVENDIVFDEIVLLLESDNTNIKTVLNRVRLKKYHKGLFNYLLNLPDDEGILYILNQYNSVLFTFPEASLLQLLQKIIDSDKKSEYLDKLIHIVSHQPMIHHRKFHEKLLDNIIKLVEISYHQHKSISSILSIYPPIEIRKIAKKFYEEKESQMLLVIRMIEGIIRRLLIDESGKWIDD